MKQTADSRQPEEHKLKERIRVRKEVEKKVDQEQR
jgi:hypothetical protein